MLICSVSHAGITKVVVWEHTLYKPNLISTTLFQALDITKAEYGDYEIISSHPMPQDRALKEISNGKLDVGHFIATEEREKNALVIRIPIMQGLLGYRICLIKEGNQHIFDNITNQVEWIEKNITIGQQTNWPDTEILKTNGFNVATTFKYELLFQQLAKERFTCFARGANEINREFIEYDTLDLAIEKNIVIYYPFPLFYFVNPHNKMLAERLELGLNRLQQNGTANKLFEQNFSYILHELSLDKRHILKLNNPTLSTETINAINHFPMLKK